MLISLVKIAVLLQLLMPDAEVATLDGSRFVGTLKSIDQQQVVLEATGGKAVNVPLADALELTLAADAAVAGSGQTLRVVLADKSSIPVDKISSDATDVRSVSELLGTLNFARSAVRAALLQPMNPDWVLQWDAYLQRSNEKDMLIVQKKDGVGLDFLSGVVGSVSAESVAFLFDGNDIPVPRPRVVGVVFADVKNSAQRSSTPLSLQLMDGSILSGSSVTMSDSMFQVESGWGQRLQIPVSAVLSVDFSSGRLNYLSDLQPILEQYAGLDPDGKEWGPLFDEDRGSRTGLSSQWRMSRDRFPNSGRPPLTLRGRRYQKGLCIFPSATIEYALDGKYSSLKAVLGVDDDVAFNQQKGAPDTAVELKILVDGESVFQKLIGAREAPIPLDLNLKGANTLTIVVDFGDGSSMCDYLDLADAKLVVDTTQK